MLRTPEFGSNENVFAIDTARSNPFSYFLLISIDERLHIESRGEGGGQWKSDNGGRRR